MSLMSLYEHPATPWQSMAPDNRHLIQIAFNHASIPFWRSKLWFENDKAWSQWMPLAKTATADEAFRQACHRIHDATAIKAEPTS